MPILKSTLDPASPAFAANRDAMDWLVAELREKTETARQGGPERSRERHTERGKLLPRERVERLIDPGAAFLEIGGAGSQRHV